jgi:hypothetical protein
MKLQQLSTLKNAHEYLASGAARIRSVVSDNLVDRESGVENKEFSAAIVSLSTQATKLMEQINLTIKKFDESVVAAAPTTNRY